tara:strand:+ start:492 stop:812 length:321 start_codon:yes stop_codon:yes gene_type:complete
MVKLFRNVYRVVENPKEDDAAIEIVSGEFEGLVYQYGKVQFVDNKNHLNFQRTIRRLPEGKTEEDMDEYLNNKELETLMGDILVELMEEQIERDKEIERAETKGTD